MKRKLNKHSTPAQTMVEFALVLPILMMLVVGILEVGLMVFVYVTVATASREAVRYGSATGLNISGGIERYKNCLGIRQAALNVDFLNAIGSPNNIDIYYYHNNNISPNFYATCPVVGSDPKLSEFISGDRIQVIVSGEFIPIFSNFLLISRTIDNNNPIKSSNYHTLLGTVELK